MNKYARRRAVAGVTMTLLAIGGSTVAVANWFSNLNTVGSISGTEQASSETTVMTITDYSANGVNSICPFCGQIIDDAYVFLTWSEIRLLASLIDVEAGTESYDCKKAIVSVVFNRMHLTDDSLISTLYADNQFASVDDIRNHTPSEESIQAVTDVLSHGIILPEYVTFFKTNDYHQWGDQMPYIQLGNTYFSYSESLKTQLSN